MGALTGLEVFLSHPPDVVRGQRLGVLCNPASVDRDLRLAVDLLAAEGRRGAWRLTRLFGAEHGLRGELAAGAHVPDSVDPITGLPVSSLHGARHAPTAEALADVDVLVVDMMQVGVRFYTRQVITAIDVQKTSWTRRRRRRPVDRPRRDWPCGGGRSRTAL